MLRHFKHILLHKETQTCVLNFISNIFLKIEDNEQIKIL